MLADPRLQQQLKAEREASGADRYDEVWEGITMMTPLPNNEHQQVVTRLACILQEVVGWPGLRDVCAGVNLSDRDEDWEHYFAGTFGAIESYSRRISSAVRARW
jgi:hypothetical protein